MSFTPIDHDVIDPKDGERMRIVGCAGPFVNVKRASGQTLLVPTTSLAPFGKWLVVRVVQP